MNRPRFELTLKVGRLPPCLPGGVFQSAFQQAESAQSELDTLMVVVVNVIIHARFVRINAVGRSKPEVLGLDGAEETFNCRVVKALALAAHALFDSTSLDTAASAIKESR